MTAPPNVTLSLPDIEQLASEGGYSGLANLSQTTAALILSAALWFENHAVWTGANFGELSPAEIDRIDEITALAQGEIMQSMIGTIVPVATAVLPPNTLLCDGTTYLEADYPELYAALDAAFQISPTQFNVPDLRSRFVIGEGGPPMGSSGGQRSITLATNQLPAHSHGYRANPPILVTVGAGAPVSVGNGVPILSNTSNTGSGAPIDILNPYVALAFVIISGRP